MKRLNIGVDIDGTLTEPFYWLRRANEYFGTSVREDRIIHYDYHEALGVSRQRIGRLIRNRFSGARAHTRWNRSE